MNPEKNPAVDQKMSIVDFQQLREKVRAEFLGPKFKGSFRKFATKRGHKRLRWLKEILFMGVPTAQEVQEDKKEYHQLYGEVIQDVTREKTVKALKRNGLKKSTRFFFCKKSKTWLTPDENRGLPA